MRNVRPATTVLLFFPLAWFLAAGLAWPIQAKAHPHAFVEAFVTFVYDEEGLAGIRERWVLGPMLTVTVLDHIGEDRDGTLCEAEKASVEANSFSHIKKRGCFTDIRVDGQPFDVEWVTDFKTWIHGGKLAWEFFIPCHVKAAQTPRTVTAAVYDESFYTFVSYGQEDGPSLDPTRDPLFANRAAEARPGDYERFASAVGVTAYSGDVRVEGPVERFSIRAEVTEDADMAYFYDQITPQVFRMVFTGK
jgi:ABC-type uncharacterized transport system substrate-binding protein